ncbi:DNA-binding transcriptional regulator [Xanthobacter flavus]|uniref:DNA-binding transcriptional regulator n=1 Tax=Xanthobacter flavus TaxID=281 RepID=A0A9W6FMC2_XANFL|nr:DNA-binding transcriptional regulator [Xanthobacter flavus]
MVSDTIRLEKTANLLTLAQLLAASAEGMTLDQIAGHFSVNRRTAERMRDAVRDLFPGFESVVDGKQRRFRITGGLGAFFIAPSVSELAELETACKGLQQAGHHPRAALLRALQTKITAALRDTTRRKMATDMEALCRAEAIARHVGPHAITDEATLQVLREALIAMTRVRFSYPLADRPEGYVRTVVPYGLLFGANAYLVGREAGRPDAVLWRLDRMRGLKMTAQAGGPPEGFNLDAYAARSFGTYQEPPVRVVLRFAPEATEAARMVFHPTQETRRLEDGRLEVSFVAGGKLEMVHHLFTWGTMVEIVEPPELRDLMISELKAALAGHERPTRTRTRGTRGKN